MAAPFKFTQSTSVTRPPLWHHDDTNGEGFPKHSCDFNCCSRGWPEEPKGNGRAEAEIWRRGKGEHLRAPQALRHVKIVYLVMPSLALSPFTVEFNDKLNFFPEN
jgi:hypothetical protein